MKKLMILLILVLINISTYLYQNNATCVSGKVLNKVPHISQLTDLHSYMHWKDLNNKSADCNKPNNCTFGSYACLSTSTTMILSYYNILRKPDPFINQMNQESCSYGFYVSYDQPYIIFDQTHFALLNINKKITYWANNDSNQLMQLKDVYGVWGRVAGNIYNNSDFYGDKDKALNLMKELQLETKHINITSDNQDLRTFVKNSIDANHPILWHITGHYLVCVGYNETESTFEYIMHDPFDIYSNGLEKSIEIRQNFKNRTFDKIPFVSGLSNEEAWEIIGTPPNSPDLSPPKNLQLYTYTHPDNKINYVGIKFDKPDNMGNNPEQVKYIMNFVEADDNYSCNIKRFTFDYDGNKEAKSYYLMGPKDCIKYTYWVTAFNNVGESEPSNKVDFTLYNGTCNSPSPPQILAVSLKDNKPYLTWKIPGYIGDNRSNVQYKIYRGNTKNNYNWNSGSGQKELYYHNTSATLGTTYYYAVTAINSYGESSFSNEISISLTDINEVKPSAPQNLNITLKDGKPYLTWMEPLDKGKPPFVAYKIYRGLSPGKDNWNMIWYQNFLQDNMAVEGNTYYYWVSAFNKVGESISQTISITVPLVTKRKPSAPKNLSIVIKNDKPYLSWFEPTDKGQPQELTYKIYRGTTTLKYDTFFSTQLNSGTFYIDLTANENKYYFYVITAINSSGESLKSNEYAIYVPKIKRKPSSPLNLSAFIQSGKPFLSWSEPIDKGEPPSVFYKIYRGLSQRSYNWSKSWIYQKYINDVLATKGKYYYCVVAVNSAGESDYSNEIYIEVP